jgi:hypothetical protein
MNSNAIKNANRKPPVVSVRHLLATAAKANLIEQSLTL